MRVAVVCPYAFDEPGGVQDQVARIVSWLRGGGHEAWAVAPGTGGPEGTRHVGAYRSIPANRSRAPIALSPGAVRRVADAVSDADVVHVHEPLMPMVSLGAVLADTPPVVGTFHADPGRVARAMYRGLAPLVRAIVRRLAVVTAVSEVAAAPLHRIAEPRIVPNGIDLEPYEEAAEGDSEPGLVAFIGRDEPRKGLDVLLDAWPDVLEAAPQARLVVMGASSRVAAPDRVEFLGRVGDDVKVARLGAAEVMTAPNLGGESFGIVVLEGLAAGCAMVASDLAAFRAVAGDAAVYVPAGDPAALGGAVSSLLESAQQRDALAAAGRERARAFGREAVLGGYLEAYAAAVDEA